MIPSALKSNFIIVLKIMAYISLKKSSFTIAIVTEIQEPGSGKEEKQMLRSFGCWH